MKHHLALLIFSIFLAFDGLAETRIGGRLFVDSNSNGRFDKGEQGIEGMRISLMSIDREVIHGHAATDERGRFVFSEDFVTPSTPYFFVIFLDIIKEPLFSSYPTITTNIGYQALKVMSGASGTSRLGFEIGYAPGFCGTVPNLRVRSARLATKRLKSIVSAGGYNESTLYAAADKIAQVSFGLGAIGASKYRCGYQGNSCIQTSTIEFKNVIISSLRELRLLLRKRTRDDVQTKRIEQLIRSIRSKTSGVSDLVEDCSYYSPALNAADRS